MIARSVESGTAAMEARIPGDEYSTSESVDGELDGYGESKPESFEVTFNIAIIKPKGYLAKPVKTAWTGCRWNPREEGGMLNETGLKC